MIEKDKNVDDPTDKSVDTDIDSQNVTRRKRQLEGWNEQQAREIAKQEGIDLTDEHLAVVRQLQDYYIEHGQAANGRELDEMLDKEFASQGGRKYLHQLFTNGPVAQGMRIAGLSTPAYTEDEGFGTAR